MVGQKVQNLKFAYVLEIRAHVLEILSTRPRIRVHVLEICIFINWVSNTFGMFVAVSSQSYLQSNIIWHQRRCVWSNVNHGDLDRPHLYIKWVTRSPSAKIIYLPLVLLLFTVTQSK